MSIFNEQGKLTGQWHQCPNILTDKLIGQVISPNAGWIVLKVWRLTEGINGRSKAAIPTESFMKFLGISKKHTAYKFVKEAVTSGLIIVEKVKGMVNVYSINKNCSLWSGLGVVPKIGTRVVPKIDTRVVPKIGTLIKTDLKDKKENNNNRKSDCLISIKDWQQPTLSEINEQLKNCKTVIPPLTSDNYQHQIKGFVINAVEKEVAREEYIHTEEMRIHSLVLWIERDYNYQQNKAKAKAKPVTTKRFNIYDEDWGKGTADQPVTYCASHISDEVDNNYAKLALNGATRPPLPNMTTEESYELVNKAVRQGEALVAAYDRLQADINKNLLTNPLSSV